MTFGGLFMKKLSALFAVFLIIVVYAAAAFADGEDYSDTAEAMAAQADSIPYSYVLMEGSTGTLLYSDNGNAEFRPFHSAKLMTLLLMCEAIDAGTMSLDDTVTVSKHANSQQGSQIWLDVGEKIKLSELVAAVTVGNANDACVAIAEAVAGTEESFVSLMNLRANELGMLKTFYADSTGVADGSATTACDTAVLASALSHYDFLNEYFTTWMTTVRGGKAELVSQNRLVRSYEGITGMKAYYHRDCLNCLVASAKRDGLTMICVIFGDPDEFERFSTAKQKMTVGFSAYTLYTPKRRDIFPEPVAVKDGVKGCVDSVAGQIGSFIVRSGRVDDIEIKYEYFEDVKAPVRVGDVVGRAIFMLDDEEIYKVDLEASEQVKKMNIFYAIGKLIKLMFS